MAIEVSFQLKGCQNKGDIVKRFDDVGSHSAKVLRCEWNLEINSVRIVRLVARGEAIGSNNYYKNYGLD